MNLHAIPPVSSATNLLPPSPTAQSNSTVTVSSHLYYLKLLGGASLFWSPHRSPNSQWMGCFWVRCPSFVQSMAILFSNTAWSAVALGGVFPLEGCLGVADTTVHCSLLSPRDSLPNSLINFDGVNMTDGYCKNCILLKWLRGLKIQGANAPIRHCMRRLSRKGWHSQNNTIPSALVASNPIHQCGTYWSVAPPPQF